MGQSLASSKLPGQKLHRTEQVLCTEIFQHWRAVLLSLAISSIVMYRDFEAGILNTVSPLHSWSKF